MCIRFALLANCISLNIFVHERCEARPPEFKGDKLAGFQISRVAHSLMVMATSKDGPVERGVGGNVNTSLVGEDTLGILPIRQTRTEGWEN